jgi:hypothetical protein
MQLVITDEELRQYRNSGAARLHIIARLVEAGAPIELFWQDNLFEISWTGIVARERTHDNEIIFKWRDTE